MDSLVTTHWLADALGAPDLRILDATYVDAALGRDPAVEFAAAHIPGALFLDLGNLRDKASPLPMTMPDEATFAAHLSALGVAADDRIVVYDDSPWRTAARAWWMLTSFGARHVAILDGGLPKWRAEGRPLEIGTPRPTPTTFAAHLDATRLRSLDQMKATADQIVDARSAARFTGAEADPRPGIAPGHIPGARNLPYPQVLNPDGTYRDETALAAAFAGAGIDPAAPVVATCGSGITAAVLAFAAHHLGHVMPIYDGSWTEWGGDPSTPKATGTA